MNKRSSAHHESGSFSSFLGITLNAARMPCLAAGIPLRSDAGPSRKFSLDGGTMFFTTLQVSLMVRKLASGGQILEGPLDCRDRSTEPAGRVDNLQVDAPAAASSPVVEGGGTDLSAAPMPGAVASGLRERR